MNRETSFVEDGQQPRVLFDSGSVKLVGSEVSRLGKRRAVVISTSSAGDLASSIAAQLGDKFAGRISGVPIHVPVTAVTEALAEVRTARADLLVAIGGGSAVGLAKAIAVLSSLPILAVPTTYAGSEMTSVWGQTNNGQKVVERDPRALPRTVIYDSDLTLNLPSEISATSGMNAVAHCVESLYAPDATPKTTLLAGRALVLLAQGLPDVVVHPNDSTTRSRVLLGAHLAGKAMESTTMGLHHKLCHTLVGAAGLPHASAHSALLPYVLAFNEMAAGHALQPLRAALAPVTNTSQTLGAALWEFVGSIKAPTSLGVIGLSRDDVPAIAAGVDFSGISHPRPVSPQNLTSILLAAQRGLVPDDAVGSH